MREALEELKGKAHLKEWNTNRKRGSDLSEITRMVFIHQDSVVMLTTSVTTTSGVGSVFAHSSVTSRDMASLLSVVVQSGWLNSTRKNITLIKAIAQYTN